MEDERGDSSTPSSVAGTSSPTVSALVVVTAVDSSTLHLHPAHPLVAASASATMDAPAIAATAANGNASIAATTTSNAAIAATAATTTNGNVNASAAAAAAAAATKAHLRYSSNDDDFARGAWAVVERGSNMISMARVYRSDHVQGGQQEMAEHDADEADVVSVDGNGGNKSAERETLEDLDLQYDDGEIENGQGLARAIQVEDGDDDFIDPSYLPAGLEFDPDAKPVELVRRQERYHTIRFYSVVALVLASIGALCFTISFLLRSKNVVALALNDRDVLGIREYVLLRLLSADEAEQVMLDPTNPYRLALDWIQYTDVMALTPHNGTRFTQRFITAYFYFCTAVDHPWTFGCAPFSADDDEGASNGNDCDVSWQEEFEWEDDVKSTSFIISGKRWLSPTHECDWGGVVCDSNSNIRSFRIWDANTTGSFPVGIAGLPFLKNLALANGGLSGPLPSILGGMKHLSYVELLGNRFTGSIPENWFNSRSLIGVNVRDNELVGTLSAQVGNWKDARSIQLHGNSLTGSLPVAIGDLKSIYQFSASNNQLTGVIPTSIGGIRHLVFCTLGHNKLSGGIPPEIGRVEALYRLHIQSNNLHGTIPTEMHRLSNLDSIILSDNNFTGPIWPLTNLSKLAKIRIENNQFSGTLPSELGLLKMMEVFTASGNNFSGTVPRRVCNLVTHKNEMGSNKVLATLQLDCGGMESTEEISCPVDCCTHCCDANGANCRATTNLR